MVYPSLSVEASWLQYAIRSCKLKWKKKMLSPLLAFLSMLIYMNLNSTTKKCQTSKICQRNLTKTKNWLPQNSILCSLLWLHDINLQMEKCSYSIRMPQQLQKASLCRWTSEWHPSADLMWHCSIHKLASQWNHTNSVCLITVSHAVHFLKNILHLTTSSDTRFFF